MNKKMILSCLTGFALLFNAPACTNLDENVYDKLPADDFGNTLVEVNALMGTVYNTLKKSWPAGLNYLSEHSGSMAVTPTRIGGDWYDGGQYREFYMHTYTSQTSEIKSAWSSASSAIGTCNATIKLLENSELLTDAEKTMNIAAMRGVRAYWYYAMMDNWGDIPLVTDYDDKELPSNTPRQDVFNWLIEEVNAIKDNCPAGNHDNYGKFTQGSAYTLLAKLLLNVEAWGITYSGNAYSELISACDKVLAMDYILEPNWKDNFSTTNDNSQEAILAICFSNQDTSDQNQMMNRTLHYADNASDNATYGAWNGMCAQPDYVKLFDTEDPRYEGSFRIGQRYNATTGEMLYTQHNDPLSYTVDFTIIAGSERDGTNWGDVVQEAGARCQKWDYAAGLTDAMGNHFHIFRLADVYLMKAEALLRSGGSTAEATNLVNAIRERAYGNSNKNYTTVTLDEVALERKFELAWEGMSRQDDIRFGTFEKGYWSASNCELATSPHLRLFPISQDAWQTNPNLKQNPGYASFD